LKFKAQAKRIQLLERISTQYLVIDVDIAKHPHVTRAVNFCGALLGTPLH